MQSYWPNIQLPNEIRTYENESLFLDLKYAIETAIKYHVQDVTNVIIDDIYTHEEFEEDLGLK